MLLAMAVGDQRLAPRTVFTLFHLNGAAIVLIAHRGSKFVEAELITLCTSLILSSLY